MEHKPYVGILVTNAFYKKIPFGNTGPEELSLYEEACSIHGMTPCFVRIRDLASGGPAIIAYVNENGKYKRRRVPYPRVIHNRAIFKTTGPSLTIQRLVRSGVPVFNTRTRYSKLEIHKLLEQMEDIRPHLPETFAASLKSIHEMRRKYPSLVIKPDNGSIGRGIMRLQLLEDGCWELQYPSAQTSKWLRARFFKQLPIVLKHRLRKRRYLVQQLLPLACYKGSPFDLRVSVQRGEDGEWLVTGIVGKVARRGSFLTNVAQGGKTYPLSTLLAEYPQLHYEVVSQQIVGFSLRVAECLSKHLPGLADLGLDIGLTEDGFPMFIEANGRDQRYSFREAGMLEEWKNTYRNPMGYAHFLSKS